MRLQVTAASVSRPFLANSGCTNATIALLLEAPLWRIMPFDARFAATFVAGAEARLKCESCAEDLGLHS